MRPIDNGKLAIQASDLIGTMSALNDLDLSHYFSDCAEMCQW